MHTWRLQQQHCVRVRSLLSTIFTFHSQAWLPLETLADCDWRARCVCNIARTPHSPHTQTHTRLCCGLLLRRPGCCDDPSTVHRHRASTLHPALVGIMSIVYYRYLLIHDIFYIFCRCCIICTIYTGFLHIMIQCANMTYDSKYLGLKDLSLLLKFE